jgi:hypothetical protein
LVGAGIKVSKRLFSGPTVAVVGVCGTAFIAPSVQQLRRRGTVQAGDDDGESARAPVAVLVGVFDSQTDYEVHVADYQLVQVVRTPTDTFDNAEVRMVGDRQIR